MPSTLGLTHRPADAVGTDFMSARGPSNSLAPQSRQMEARKPSPVWSASGATMKTNRTRWA